MRLIMVVFIAALSIPLGFSVHAFAERMAIKTTQHLNQS